MDREFLWRLLRMATGPLGNLPQVPMPGARHGSWIVFRFLGGNSNMLEDFHPERIGVLNGIYNLTHIFQGWNHQEASLFFSRTLPLAWVHTAEVLVVIGIFFAWTLAYYLSTSKVRPKRIITICAYGFAYGSFLGTWFYIWLWNCCLVSQLAFSSTARALNDGIPRKKGRPPKKWHGKHFDWKDWDFTGWPRLLNPKIMTLQTPSWTWVWFN